MPTLLLLSLLVLLPFWAQAGIALSQSRLIYQHGEIEHSLLIANSNPYPILVQLWVDDGQGNLERQLPASGVPFLSTTPIFNLQAEERRMVRILYNQMPMPQDRESMYWLNLYEVPLSSHGEQPPLDTDYRLSIAMNTQIKLFYRPAALQSDPQTHLKALRCTLKRSSLRWQVVCDNPTPYYFSITEVAVQADGKSYPALPQADMTIAPVALKRYPLPQLPDSVIGSGVTLRFVSINDQGQRFRHARVLPIAPVMRPTRRDVRAEDDR
ncbi:fimbrial biogenesis chaperone [Pseudomonas sp. PGPR81]|uniref:fimbrial biogenesis chaperone n=1 Tax=Pseudomonas sp. PGPR81 TaxID=2913477 RepID=UPI001EDA22C6|nr:molecular chaperone [Pseudomonas sp. PGPR81]